MLEESTIILENSQENQTQAATFTLFSSSTLLCKEFSTDGNVIAKISHANMYAGGSETLSMSLQQLKDVIPTLEPYQALGLGTLRSDLHHTRNNLCTKSTLNNFLPNAAHTRSKENYIFKEQQTGICLFDYDGSEFETLDDVYQELMTLLPELKECEALGVSSSSRGIYVTDAPHVKTKANGCHFYVVVNDQMKIQAIGGLLRLRSWQQGKAYFRKGKKSFLESNVFDRCVFTASRIIFEAPPIVGNNLSREQRNVKLFNANGGAFDVAATMPILNGALDKKNHLPVELSKELTGLVRDARNKLKDKIIKDLTAEGLSPEKIKKVIDNLLNCILTAEDTLQGEKTGENTVTRIIAEIRGGTDLGKQFLNDTFLDPNGEDHEFGKTELYANEDGSIILNSFAHGGAAFRLTDTTEIDESPYLNQTTAEEPPIESRKKLWLNADDMAINAKPAKYLIDQILVEDAHGILGGASMALKSFTVLKMAHCICTGNAFMGNAVYKTGKVIYICGEGKGALERRMRALTVTQGGFNNNLIVLNIDISIDNELNMKFLAEQIQEIQPVLVIFDTFASLISNTEENSTSAVGNVLRLVKSTCKTITNTTSIIVHHYGKDASKGLRGASNFTNDTEFNFLLERTLNTLNTTLSCGKQKDGEEFAPISLKARIVQLGFTEQSGKESTSLVIEEGNGVTSKKADFNPETKEIFTALSEIINSGETVSLECLAFAVESGLDVLSAKMVLESEWRKHSDSKKTGSTDAKRMAFARSKKVLMEKNKILIFEGYVILVEQKPF